MNRTDAGTKDNEAARYHSRQTQDGEVAQLFKGAQRSEVVDEDVRLFLVKGYSGDYVAFLLKFDPLPLDATSVSYIVPDLEPFKAWGANNKGYKISNMDVEELRANQSLFNYHERVVVK